MADLSIAALQDLEQADPAQGRDIRAKCLWKMSVDMSEAMEVNAMDGVPMEEMRAAIASLERMQIEMDGRMEQMGRRLRID